MSRRGAIHAAGLDRAERVRAHLTESADVARHVAADHTRPILAAADLLAAAFRGGGKVLLCGNGGSAADCQHLAAEFVNRLTKEFPRPGLPAIALTTDSSVLTAVANDTGVAEMFARQVETFGRSGDVLIAISTSGDSPNVLRAVEAAHAGGLKTIALTGAAGRLGAAATVSIAVPSASVQHIQEAHLAIEHLLCDLVERALFADRGDRPE
jgi:D-sedoheptulose 7-phosphate isomerase